MFYSVTAALLGFLLDALLGDPHGFPHPVRWIGRLIAALEKQLRKCFPKTARGEQAAGILLAVLTVGISGGCAWALLFAAGRVHRLLAFALEILMSYQLVAARSLCTESRKVAAELRKGDLAAARTAVSMIVGRDTERLTPTQVAKAAVETVAENASDGVIAPLFYLLLGGAPLGFCYKAVNTLDSMVGYQNEAYLHFGRCSAKLDDLANWVPARLSALLMVCAAWLLRMDGRGAFRIWKRDRRCHASPNSAQTEAVCAGALGVQLAGNASYGGKLVKKPTIGDDLRPVTERDIDSANRLMYAASLLALGVFSCVRCMLILIL